MLDRSAATARLAELVFDTCDENNLRSAARPLIETLVREGGVAERDLPPGSEPVLRSLSGSNALSEVRLRRNRRRQPRRWSLHPDFRAAGPALS
jgi:hypothetical protein